MTVPSNTHTNLIVTLYLGVVVRGLGLGGGVGRGRTDGSWADDDDGNTGQAGGSHAAIRCHLAASGRGWFVVVSKSSQPPHPRRPHVLRRVDVGHAIHRRYAPDDDQHDARQRLAVCEEEARALVVVAMHHLLPVDPHEPTRHDVEKENRHDCSV